MNPQQLPLADIHLPGQIALWPPAYGWWILTLLILTLLYFCIKGIRTFKANRVQKNIALNQLAAIDLADPSAWQQINETLKRAAMAYHSREHVASLTGEKWKQFLLEQIKKPAVEFDDNWLHFAYVPNVDATQVKNYHQFAAHWLKQALPVKKAAKRAAKSSKSSGGQNV